MTSQAKRVGQNRTSPAVGVIKSFNDGHEVAGDEAVAKSPRKIHKQRNRKEIWESQGYPTGPQMKKVQVE